MSENAKGSEGLIPLKASNEREAKQEIIDSIERGCRVFEGKSKTYEVIKDSIGQFLVICHLNDYCIGLHGLPGTAYEDKLNVHWKDIVVQEPELKTVATPTRAPKP